MIDDRFVSLHISISFLMNCEFLSVHLESKVNNLDDIVSEDVVFKNASILSVLLTQLIFTSARCHTLDDMKNLSEKLYC